jgi:hypothetical protein
MAGFCPAMNDKLLRNALKGEQSMKRIALAIGLIAFALASSLAVAQTIIENPAKPDNPQAGRTVTLQEVMRIEDTGKDFYIKYVFGLRVAPDGSIIINDSGEQALQFDAQGRFVRNLMKKGQGPGELTSLDDIWVEGNQIILCGSPLKAIIFGHDGKMVREITIRGSAYGSFNFVDSNEGNILFSCSGGPDVKGGSGWKDSPQEIIIVAMDRGQAKTLGSFSLPGWVSTASGSTGVMVYQQFIAVPAGKKNIVISHTPDYLIKLIDSESGNVIRQFRRVYDRIKTKSPRNVTNPGNGRPPVPEYWADIQALHVVGDKLWVQTSTVDPKKGFLFDVFNLEGRYIDRFYLKWSDKDVDPNRVGQRFTFAGGFVYFADKTADDLVVIRKCRLAGL